MCLGIKRAPSDYALNVLRKHWQAPRVEVDLMSSSYKRKKLSNVDDFLKDSVSNLDENNFKINNKQNHGLDLCLGLAGATKKPSNGAMIKAIDSDDAMDYLRVRKQAGESKINIKKAKVFDRGAQGVNQDQDDDDLLLGKEGE